MPIHITRKSIKHLYLRIDDEGNVKVSAPQSMPEADILSFVSQKQDWIAEKQHRRAAAALQNAQFFTLFGQKHLLVRHFSQTHNQLILADGNCHLYLQASDVSSAQTTEKKMIIAYWRQQLIPMLDGLVAHYRPIIGVSPAEIRTKNMKTKWGTCNPTAKRLWFNVQLARFTPKCIEYVVVHEMVHLLERRHNRRFYRLVANAMPDWQQYHEALKRAN